MNSNVLISVVLYKPDKNDFLKLLKSLITSDVDEGTKIDVCFIDNSPTVSIFVQNAVKDFANHYKLRPIHFERQYKLYRKSHDHFLMK